MDDPDVLVRTIHALKEEQTAAWRQLAASSLTTFERREVRNQLRWLVKETAADTKSIREPA
jgi:hypothetical protein